MRDLSATDQAVVRGQTKRQKSMSASPLHEDLARDIALDVAETNKLLAGLDTLRMRCISKAILIAADCHELWFSCARRECIKCDGDL